jgi:regulator of replication initiation timing
LTRDKQTISEQLKQKVGEIGELEERLKKSQEENKQLKQKATKNVGLDASSSTDQKETKEMEVQTDVKKDDFRDLYDKKGKHVRTELSDPSLTPAEDPEKSRHKA